MPQQELVPVEEGPPKFALDNEEAIQACNIWQYWLWNFQTGGTKLERFLPQNQHTQKEIIEF